MKLRTKILLSMALLTSALTAASLFIVRRSVGLHAREEILQSFRDSTITLRDYQSRNDTIARRTADLISETPVLKAVMTTHDAPTIQDATAPLWQNAGGDLLVLKDATGRLVAVHNSGTPLPQLQVDRQFSHFSDGITEWWMLDGRLYRVAIKSIGIGGDDGNLLGTLAVGYEVGPAALTETARIANGSVAFRYGSDFIGSSLTGSRFDALKKSAASLSAGDMQEVNLDGEHFLAHVIDLSSEAQPVQLVVLRSYDQATVFLQRINSLIVIVGAVVIALGAAFVFLLSHTFTQPLDELLNGVRRLSNGDFAFQLHARGKDEIAELTTSFDGMRKNLQQSQERLVTSARMEAVGQLAGGVAHDFNNLITVIKGYADLLTSQIGTEDPLIKYAEQISKAGDRASSLTRQLLAFSRNQKSQREAVDLNMVVNNLGKMLKVLVGERYEVTTAGDPKLVRVMADSSQLEQVVINLAVNARDAMPEGGRIEIRTDMAIVDSITAARHNTMPGRFARLSVIDHGCGMDAEHLTKIFQPFFTTKEVGKGTGLGLAIVFGAVKQCEGFIDVRSQLGQGSTFEIYLPELKSEVRPAAVEQKKPALLRGSETILVVEDEEGVRNMIRDTLQLRGYTVILACNGEEAMQIMHDYRGTIDLVLSDVVMPKLGGLDLAVRLGASTRKARVLLMCGYTERINEIEEAKLPLIRKPFSPDKLVERIQEMLGAAKHRELVPA